jgi:lantibiotic leader peptide-processing serine protease
LRRRTTAFIALLACLAALVLASSASAARYVIVYQRQAVPADAEERIARAGGRLIAEYNAIGVAVAESDNELFRTLLLRDRRVAGAAASEPAELGNAESVEAEGPPPGDLPNAPATDADTFSSLQWNMERIRAPQAHTITGGSPAVVAGVIDTGIDPTHPNLDDNIDAANSVSCVGGAPNQSPAAWDDDSGHGTHVAGIIAAESNGIGVVGVAPRVKVAAIKASLRVGTRDIFRPEAVVCALMWAGGAGFDLPSGPDIPGTVGPRVDVANNSYTVDQELITDPLDFFCHNDPDDQDVITAVKRATRFALSRGVTLAASAGNNNLDLAHPPLGNECLRLPSELSGVITVSSTRRTQSGSEQEGNLADQKSSFSNYGVGVIDVAAPGGEVPPFSPPPTEFILSTWPGKFFAATLLCDPVQTPCPVNAAGVAYYRFMAGSSMSAAHVSGVAALVISRFGDADTPQNGKLRPGQVAAIIEQTADPTPCPPDPTTCQGGEGYNGWFGHGRVNAFRAVTHDAGG